jgi:hypothetical protein
MQLWPIQVNERITYRIQRTRQLAFFHEVVEDRALSVPMHCVA